MVCLEKGTSGAKEWETETGRVNHLWYKANSWPSKEKPSCGAKTQGPPRVAGTGFLKLAKPELRDDFSSDDDPSSLKVKP